MDYVGLHRTGFSEACVLRCPRYYGNQGHTKDSHRPTYSNSILASIEVPVTDPDPVITCCFVRPPAGWRPARAPWPMQHQGAADHVSARAPIWAPKVRRKNCQETSRLHFLRSTRLRVSGLCLLAGARNTWHLSMLAHRTAHCSDPHSL